jgi:predicted Rossmann fold nucleotide-binding protein DprA/Smf involved in DNA uptake
MNQKKLHFIFKNKSNFKEVFNSISFSFLKQYSFTDKQIAFILENKTKLKLDFLEKKMLNRSVEIVTINDKKYPELLKQIPNPPYLFYLR